MPRSSTVKLCAKIPRTLHFRLSAMAAHLGRTKEGLVVKLLDQGLAGYKHDAVLRQIAGEPLPQESLPDSPPLRVKAS
jgi:hypothetical protein